MKRYLTLLIASALMLATIALPANAKQGDTQSSLEKVRIKIAKLGIGEKAKATVYLKDGAKKKGYVAQAGDDDFVLRDRRTDAPATIRYVDVTKVDSNRGHSTARNLGIGIAVGAGVVLTVIAVLISSLDD